MTSSNLSTIKINNCSNKFIIEFFMEIKAVNFQISTLIFSDINFISSGLETISQKIIESSLYMSITSLGFIKCTCVGSSFLDFISVCAVFCKKLENLQVEWRYIDVCDILLGISRCKTTIKKPCLKNNTGHTIIAKDTMIIPPTLLYIDVGYCEWIPESFIAFI